ncbi:glycosyltransferase [Nesterenkonia xinjiangensis]|uniref:Glycosyltransferase involved in cell wall biosynthesis/methylmalonyl-CoA mutase cobalamin-binding subunit n=1 Tax=Nesterenkonia xinjiangensis TaxID=225327 RepID=A0A7Z0GKW5_9MICC|nr:glycosyltransferase [Nesterenkonia xinjiangensis]NYJ76996.1 glycosyltransferase involved in cell wall biosynthesis/methylmalonyl-CoA mutase cobalamin-binding subunit [Nesterenkonia xinjiangensis]
MTPEPNTLQYRIAQLEQGLELFEDLGTELTGHKASLEGLLQDTRFRQLSPLRATPFTHGALNAEQLLEDVRPAVEALPPGEMGISRPHSQLRIAVVCDSFFHQSMDGLVDLVPLKPKDWRNQLTEENRPDLLLVAATWKGVDGKSWIGNARPDSWRRRQLTDVIMRTFREHGIPVVYYGKEDPPNYELFLSLAQAADHILTTAEEMVPHYERDCPDAQSIGVLPFGVNPLVHTPIGSRPAASDLIHFAGSWLPEKYPQRTTYGSWALNGVIQSGYPLVIIDRHSAFEPSPYDRRYSYPRGYTPYIAPAQPREDLMEMQRVTDVAVNLNSVVASQSMFANRVLELQASGTMVISTYNQGVNSFYPQVHIANSADDVAAMLNSITLEELRRVQGDGIRKVFLDDHAINRLASIARAAGATPPQDSERILAVTDRPTDALAREMAEQTHSAVPLTSWDRLHEHDGDYDILLPVTPSRHYTPRYAADHAAAFTYQSAAVTTKLAGTAAETDDDAHRHHTGIRRLDLTAWWRPDLDGVDSATSLTLRARQARVYAVDHLNHHPADRTVTISPNTGELSGVAQALKDIQEDLVFSNADPAQLDHSAHAPLARRILTPRRPAPDRFRGDDLDSAGREFRAVAEKYGLQLSVVVPVYNNGDHLRHKAFASLRRSTIFDVMHVLLINDGSTDPATADTVEDLAHTYPNVSAFHHPEGGSGSASRPRNTGLALASTPYVTYLDPDNEAVESGYTRLYQEFVEHPEVDFVLGHMTLWRNAPTKRQQKNVKTVKFLNSLAKGMEEDEHGNLISPDDVLSRTAFMPFSIQAMIARTSWLKRLGLTQPVGGVGQDSYFSQQMLHYARRIRPVRTKVHTYYSEVSDSTVNAVSARLFHRYVPLERDRSEWLRSVGLLDEYRRTRLEGFLVSWYLKKLDAVPAEQWQEAAETLAWIVDLYGGYDGDHPRILDFYRSLHDARPEAAQEDAR